MKLQITPEQYAQLSDGLKGAAAAAGRLKETVEKSDYVTLVAAGGIYAQLNACLEKCQQAVGTMTPSDPDDEKCSACGAALQTGEYVKICASCAEEAGTALGSASKKLGEATA